MTIFEALMYIVSGTLVLLIAGFALVAVVAMCMGTYEIFTGQYKTQQEHLIEQLKQV